MTSKWTSRSLGSQWQHNIFYALIRLMGRKAAYALLFCVVSWYALLPSVRAKSRPYIQRRFPDASAVEVFLHTWRLQWNFGQCLVDRAVAGITGNYSYDETARSTIASLNGTGQGIILLCAHTGCWQMAPYELSENSGLAVNVLVYREQGDVDKQVFEHKGMQPPFNMVGTDAGPLALVMFMKLLRAGQIVCMMGDRSLGGTDPTLNVLFLGAPIEMPWLAFRLASATGAPVVFSFPTRQTSGKSWIYLGEPIHVPKDLGNTPSAYLTYVQKFAKELEHFTLEYPYQFFNFYDLWK